MLKLRVLDLFFHWNKCFCYYTESKVPKKGTVGYRYRIPGTDTGTGTGSNVNGTQPYMSVNNVQILAEMWPTLLYIIVVTFRFLEMFQRSFPVNIIINCVNC